MHNPTRLGVDSGTSSPEASARLVPAMDTPLDLAALRRGEPAAYEAAFRAYYKSLCTFAVRLVGSWDDAEEVVQGVFSALWDRHEQLRITTTVKAYLYAAVRNEALNSLKHRRVVERAERALEAGEILRAYAAAPMPPDLILERDEVTTRLRAAIATLPPRARDVLVLRWEHAMSYDEIGTVLGIQPQSAKMQQSRALAMLRKQLSDLLPASSDRG